MAITPPAAAPLPPVIELGWRLAALSAEITRQDGAALQARDDGPRHRAARRAIESLEGQRMALNALVATMPARTLADTAVQIAVAFDLANDLECNVHPADEVERLAIGLATLLLSVLPVIAAAAELNPGDMGWEAEVGYLYAGRFAGLEDVTP
ncbi:MAG: hypothetical protein ACRYHQ_14995 [Janthinobacterium lividum]